MSRAVNSTNYYTACTATHAIQKQQKPPHAYCNADKHIRSKVLLYGDPTICYQPIMAQQYADCRLACIYQDICKLRRADELRLGSESGQDYCCILQQLLSKAGVSKQACLCF